MSRRSPTLTLWLLVAAYLILWLATGSGFYFFVAVFLVVVFLFLRILRQLRN